MLDGLQRSDVGDALNGGVAIVVMAIVLDRVTTAWSKRDRTRRRPLSSPAGRVTSRMLAGVGDRVHDRRGGHRA